MEMTREDLGKLAKLVSLVTDGVSIVSEHDASNNDKLKEAHKFMGIHNTRVGMKIEEIADKISEEEPARCVASICHGNAVCGTVISVQDIYEDGFAIREHMTITVTPLSKVEEEAIVVMKRLGGK